VIATIASSLSITFRISTLLVRFDTEANPDGPLRLFVEWTFSDEARALEDEAEANTVFGFGQHRGETFRTVAAHDPDYHLRYMDMMQYEMQDPPPIIQRYAAWFDRSLARQINAIIAHNDTLEGLAGPWLMG